MRGPDEGPRRQPATPKKLSAR